MSVSQKTIINLLAQVQVETNLLEVLIPSVNQGIRQHVQKILEMRKEILGDKPPDDEVVRALWVRNYQDYLTLLQHCKEEIKKLLGIDSSL